MIKKFLLLHILPIVLVVALFFALFLLPDKTRHADIVIKGTQKTTKGRFANLNSKQEEIDFLASLKNPFGFTIFGSSEFTESPFCPYNFFPDSLNIPAIGMGHAHHQSFSILIELLAANEYLDSSTKICILLSPGWFETIGTNTEAFVEFARPNFLRKIALDEKIDKEYKLAVGQFIANYVNDFTSLNPEMIFLKDAYLYSEKSNVNREFSELKMNFKKKFIIDLDKGINYDLQLDYSSKSKKWAGDFDKIALNQQKLVLSKMTNNNLYVNDEYYSTHLKSDNKEFTPNKVVKPIVSENQEFKDLKLLVAYLKSKNVQASFAIIPLNPHAYSNLEVNSELLGVVSSILNKANFPLLDLYVTSKKSYSPGILNDVMHLSDFGWMKVNKFIYQTYYNDSH